MDIKNQFTSIFKAIKNCGDFDPTLIFKEILLKVGIKGVKGWIDDNFREKVIPKEGSVLYADLLAGAEHSGIYLGCNKISNIVVQKFAEGQVKETTPYNFTEKSLFHKKIYVSCNKDGSVGDINVSKGAESHLGEKSFYGLLFNNCHDYSRKCVEYSSNDFSIDSTSAKEYDETWEYTIKNLKNRARTKLGATKWKMWDWNATNEERIEKPQMDQIEEFFNNLPLDKYTISIIRQQLNEVTEYINEISDEQINSDAISLLNNFKAKMELIKNKYDSSLDFINLSGAKFSYNQLRSLGNNISSLVEEMSSNLKIKELTAKLGRKYISTEKKKKMIINNINKNEVFGVHQSNDLVRLLPSELSNLEDENLEYLFFSKYLENRLLTYELAGPVDSNHTSFKKGPVIACIDTSGSMDGLPINKAKAALLSISSILTKEKRELHVILFGAKNEIVELTIKGNNESCELMDFLNNGFKGDTNFETPLKRSIEIIEERKEFNSADILLITDGLCNISSSFMEYLNKNRTLNNYNIYTVICANKEKIEKLDFSDEIINI